MGKPSRGTVIVIRHSDSPPDDRVHTWLTSHGFDVDTRMPFMGDSIPAIDESVVGTVLHGGPFNAHDADKHPFLHKEYQLIEASLKADIPMLGICQGAQQIAYHLGAFAGAKEGYPHEFGYYECRPTADAGTFLTEPHYFTQAHFHTFDIPEGGVCLAGSDAYPNQAFRYGANVYGVQFHPEVTIEGFRRWQAADWAMYDKPGAQDHDTQTRLMYAHDARQAKWFYGFLSGLFGSDTE